MTDSPHIVIAGASGYIGRALIPKLLARFPQASITALARQPQGSDDPRVAWRACDLFSLRDLQAAVGSKVDLAIYLVHSMSPTARLDQGSFADYDLILADNFSRAMQACRASHVVYLGGLVPPAGELSLHLRSRLEVEETFAQYGLPTTVLRAGLVVGQQGSSFQILLKLVRHLPVMVCPRWTQTLTTPVDLDTVLDCITASALGAEHLGRTYDLAACQPLTYVAMMQATARHLGLTRRFVTVPFFTPTLSRLWVRLITGASKALVYPLVESLRHAMVPRPENRFPGMPAAIPYSEMLKRLGLDASPGRPPSGPASPRPTVRSVQRLPLPPGRDAQWVREEYLRWLPRFLAPWVTVSAAGDRVSLRWSWPGWTLIRLALSRARSDADRQLFYLQGGALVQGPEGGRFEFRVVLHRRYVLAAIHDFHPALPWYIYRFSQARLHLWVMNAFSRHLGRVRDQTAGIQDPRKAEPD